MIYSIQNWFLSVQPSPLLATLTERVLVCNKTGNGILCVSGQIVQSLTVESIMVTEAGEKDRMNKLSPAIPILLHGKLGLFGS